MNFILENPGESKLSKCDPSPPTHFSEEDDYSLYSTDDDVDLPVPIHQSTVRASPSLCAEQLSLVQLVLSGANVFYTGGAATGKSTVLRAIMEKFHSQGRRVQVVTPTGISALNVGGSTYFTYARWNPGMMKKSIKEISTIAMSKQRRQRIKSTDVLILNKISMLESNEFRRLDRPCRQARMREEAFDGIQVVVTGDFYQLPPVKASQTCFECGVELKTIAYCPSCESEKGEDFY